MSAVHQFHYSKIITPIGGALAKETVLSKVINNIDGFKIALTNIYEDTKKRYVDVIMKLDNMKTIMLELKGPEFRSKIHTPLKVSEGQTYHFEYSDFFEDKDGSIFTDYPFNDQLHQGVIITFQGGVRLEVVENNYLRFGPIVAKVLTSGEIKGDELLEVENMNVTTPYLTEKDKKDLVWSITHNLPVVVLSHVSHAQNVLDVKKYLIDSGSKGTKVFFKIQNIDSIIHFKEIIDVADGVIVEPRMYDELTTGMPQYQGKIFDLLQVANFIGKPAIVKFWAQELTGTREAVLEKVSDYFNHGMSTIQLGEDLIDMDDPTDFIMNLYQILFDSQFTYMKPITLEDARITEEYKTTDYVVYSAFRAIPEIDVKAIILYTENGYTAGMLSAYRPNIPIIAFTKSDAAYRYVNLMRAIKGYKIAPSFDYHNIKQLGKEIVRIIFKGSIALEDKILIVHASSLKLESSMINGLEVYKFKDI